MPLDASCWRERFATASRHFSPCTRFSLTLKVSEKWMCLDDDEVTAETSLALCIPLMNRLIVRPGPMGVDAEQEAWLGEHPLVR